MSGISWHKFRVPTSGTLVQVDNGHFQAIFGPYPAILVENIVFRPFLAHILPFWWKTLVFCPILMYEIDFYIQEESKNTIGNNVEKNSKGGLPWKTFSLKWPINSP